MIRPMEIYDHPTFRMACRQFDLVADHLQMPAADRDRVKYPKRALTVALPIHRDDGSTQVLTGYRVHHPLTLGPTKGGLRFHPDVTIGEVAALAGRPGFRPYWSSFSRLATFLTGLTIARL